MRGLKRAFKLMKYTYHYQSKDEKFVSLILFAVGMIALLTCMKDGFNLVMASPMLALSIAYVGRYYYALTIAHMVGASGRRKSLSLIIPNLLTVVGVFVGYLLVAAMLSVFVHFNPLKAAEYGKSLLEITVISGALIIFYGFCDKHYWFGVVLITVVLFSYVAVFPILLRDMDTFLGRPLTLQWGLVIHGVGLLISTVISCVLRVVLYKVPAMRGKLGKQMLHAM